MAHANSASVSNLGNTTLYAVWKYTVTYNANSGSGTMTASTCYAGSSCALTANAFTRTGYTFGGWASSQNNANAGTVAYADKASVSLTSNTTLYAIWKYTVTYNANGGSGTMSASTCTAGSSCTLTANTFSRANYTFAGWNTAADGTGTAYANSASVSSLGNTTLYAVWTPVSYTVTYKLNNGTNSNHATQSVVYNTAATEPPAPARTGYTFVGWYKESTCTNAWSFSTDVVTANTTLYAKWKCTTDGCCTEGQEFVIKIPFRKLPEGVMAQYRWYRNEEHLEHSNGVTSSEDSFIICTIPSSEAYGMSQVFYFEYWLNDGFSPSWAHSPKYTINFVPAPAATNE